MIDPEEQKTSRAAFLRGAGWADAVSKALAGDASTRSYERLEKKGARAVLMIAPPGAEAPACAPGAGPEERAKLGYNAEARLAGPNLNAFTAIARALREAGLSAPEIYAADAAAGFALIEDLGDDLFARIAGRDGEKELYENAIDALLKLRSAQLPPVAAPAYQMLDYDETALAAEARLFIDWYWPLRHRAPAPAQAREELETAWRALLKNLSAPHIIALRDYHAENLIWLPDRDGAARVGVIDFQDGLYGHAAYDMASLLEDARRDVSTEICEAMILRYTSSAMMAGNSFDTDQFFTDYAILAAQRNAKILGIFARLAKRDMKPRYLDFLPRVEAHFRRDLSRPGLEGLAQEIARFFPELAP